MSVNLQAIQLELNQIQRGLTEEINALGRQGLIQPNDVRKVLIDADETKRALISSAQRTDLHPDIQSGFLSGLVKEYESSIRTLIDKIISRQGDDAVIAYNLNRIDQKINKQLEQALNSNQISRENHLRLQGFMAGARHYAMNHSTSKRRSFDRQKEASKTVRFYSDSVNSYINQLRHSSNDIVIKIGG